MNIFRKILISSMAVCSIFSTTNIFATCMQHGYKFNDESLNYDIVYHWGLIWKHAASATLNINNDGNYYNASLYARTISWANNIYRVREGETWQNK